MDHRSGSGSSLFIIIVVLLLLQSHDLSIPMLPSMLLVLVFYEVRLLLFAVLLRVALASALSINLALVAPSHEYYYMP